MMYATDLALHPSGTEGVAYVGTAFATYTGLNVLIVFLAALLTLWAPSAGIRAGSIDRWVVGITRKNDSHTVHRSAQRWVAPIYLPISTYT